MEKVPYTPIASKELFSLDEALIQKVERQGEQVLLEEIQKRLQEGGIALDET